MLDKRCFHLSIIYSRIVFVPFAMHRVISRYNHFKCAEIIAGTDLEGQVAVLHGLDIASLSIMHTSS